MGFEYKLTCVPVPTELDKPLRAIPGFSEYDRQYGQYHFRAPENQDTARMADASVAIEPDGVYFIDHCGNTALANGVLRRLVDLALFEADEVIIREL